MDGTLAKMRTVDPRTFVEFKMEMSRSRTRDGEKRHRDAIQAEAVQQLLDTGLLVPQVS